MVMPSACHALLVIQIDKVLASRAIENVYAVLSIVSFE